MVVYNIYLIIVVLMTVMFSCARKKFFLSTDNRIIVDNKINVDMLCKVAFCIVAFGYLAFLAANRYDVGFDYFQYTINYSMLDECSSFSQALKAHDVYEPGYVMLEYLLCQISTDYEFFLLAHALIVNVIFAISIICYSRSVYISSVLYLTMNVFAVSMNFSRQILAIAIVFAGFGLLKKRKYFTFSLIIILASTFHLSMLLMFVAVVLCIIKPKKSIYAVLFFAAMIVLCFSDEIIEFVCEKIPKYSIYIGRIYLSMNGDTHICAIIAALSIIVILFYFFSSWKEYSQSVDIYANIAFISLIISIAMEKHYILDRFQFVFSAFYIIIIADLMWYLCKSGPSYIVKLKSVNEKRVLLKNKEFWSLIVNVVAAFVLVFLTTENYTYAADTGSHRAYPYTTMNDKLRRVIHNSKTNEEILKTTTLFPEYLELLDNDDYIVTVSYYNDWRTKNQFNKIFLDKAQDAINSLGIMHIFEHSITSHNKSGAFVIEKGNLVSEVLKGSLKYELSRDKHFYAYGLGSEHWICVDGVVYETSVRSMDFLVYSISQNKVIDYCSVIQGDYWHTPIVYHNVLDNYDEIRKDDIEVYKDVFYAMCDSSNTVIIYNNNEDYDGRKLSVAYDEYYRMLGSSITVDALCNQNVAAIRFGGEWRETIYPSSPAQIEADVNGVVYDIYADSYKSYCKINGVEVSVAKTGVNILIISPEGEIIFNGSVDIYGGYDTVTVSDDYAQIPA